MEIRVNINVKSETPKEKADSQAQHYLVTAVGREGFLEEVTSSERPEETPHPLLRHGPS